MSVSKGTEVQMHNTLDNRNGCCRTITQASREGIVTEMPSDCKS